MKYIDDETKKLYWWNRNYFFAGTIAIVLLNIILFAALGDSWTHQWGTDNGFWVNNNWYNLLDFNNFIRAFLNSFAHKNWQHVMLNMLCFLICGAWLERRKGTFGIILLVFVMANITAAFTAANHQNLNYVGYSGVNFGFYAYAITDYCFLFRKETKTKINVISGAVLMALIYLASCFEGGTTSFGFQWFPYDFMTNMGHYSSFLAGTILGLTIQLAKLAARKEAKNE